MTTIYDELYNIVQDKERILVGSEIEDKYLSDVLGHKKGHAEAVVFPLNTTEVSAILKYAYANSIPITPRGAGTNLVGSTVPLLGGIVLDLSKMNKVLEIDRSTLTATVEPGVILGEFQELVESQGLFYPPDPGDKEASIGGNISTNAGGMRAVKYGVTRDYVRGLELVLANGDIVTVGSKNVKDSSGLALKDLVIGSEGTLAIITKCILRLIAKPEKTVSVLISYPDLQIGIESVLAILHSNVQPTALEFMENSVVALGEAYTGLKLPVSEAEAYLLIIIDGSEAEIAGHIEQLRTVADRSGAVGFLPLGAETAADVWTLRGSLVKAVEQYSEQEPVDIVVPIDKSAEFIAFVHEFEKQCGMQMVAFGHAGDGNVHLCVVRGDRTEEAWRTELDANMAVVYQKAAELGGLPSGEHGIGIAKQIHYHHVMNNENLQVMQRIKKAFDDKGILNAHKSYQNLPG
jgi:glycolate oxidase